MIYFINYSIGYTNVYYLLVLYISFTFFIFNSKSLNVYSQCANQIQKCGMLVDQFERHIRTAKILAFRNCFSKSPCFKERIMFDDCFAKSLQTFWYSLRENTSTERLNNSNFAFKQIVDIYRNHLTKCFDNINQNNDDQNIKNDLQFDIDAIYARAIYSPEFSDRLWGLNEYGIRKPLIDLQSACLINEIDGRIFGSSIGRTEKLFSGFPDNSSTCVLTSKDLVCYRRTLDSDFRFQNLIINRDNAIRSCVQRVRSQAHCSILNQQHLFNLQNCICKARIILEKRMENEILNCMKNDDLMLLTKFNFNDDEKISESFFRPDMQIRFKQSSSKDSSTQVLDNNNNLNSKITIMPGIALNGQCLCACLKPQNESPKVSLSSSIDFNEALLQNEKAAKQFNVFENAPTESTLKNTPTQLDRQIWYYQPQLYQQNQQQPQRRTESGIINGFESFFKGLPPPI